MENKWELKDKLLILKEKLWEFKMSRTKFKALTIEDIQKLMRLDKPIPTNLYNVRSPKYYHVNRENVVLSIEEIQKRMRNNQPIPFNLVNMDKKTKRTRQ